MAMHESRRKLADIPRSPSELSSILKPYLDAGFSREDAQIAYIAVYVATRIAERKAYSDTEFAHAIQDGFRELGLPPKALESIGEKLVRMITLAIETGIEI